MAHSSYKHRSVSLSEYALSAAACAVRLTCLLSLNAMIIISQEQRICQSAVLFFTVLAKTLLVGQLCGVHTGTPGPMVEARVQLLIY